jgi:hypothetical protein
MKSSILTLFIAALSLITSASLAQKKYTFGIQTSYVSSKFALEGLQEAINFKNSSRGSFLAGATVNYHFNEKFSLQSGLFLVKKGGKFSFSGQPAEQEEQEEQTVNQDSFARQTNINPNAHGRVSIARNASDNNLSALPEADQYLVSAKIEASILYLEIPLNFVYTIPSSIGKFQLGAGPYYGLGLSGTITSEVTIMAEGHQTETTSEKVRFGNNEDSDFKRHDFGLNFLAGYQLNNGISIRGGYGLGLAKMDAGTSENSSFK